MKRSLEVLEALINGYDPVSGEVIENDSVLAHSVVQVALRAGLAALRAAASAPSPSVPSVPERLADHPESDVDAAEAVLDAVGLVVQNSIARFESPGWFYVGHTDARCPDCDTELEGFRKPYHTRAEKLFFYWALACSECAVLLTPGDLSKADRLGLKKHPGLPRSSFSVP